MSRTILIGDIHGCWDELRDLLAKVALTDDDRVVSVGDLVDRGPDPASVVAWFRARPNAVVVCGNHERKHVRRTLSPSQEITALQFGDAYADAVAWMGTLPYWWRGDGVLVVHAALIPGVSVEDTPEDVLCGTTSGEAKLEKQLAGRWWHELYAGPEPVVFGHHVVDDPLVRDGLVYGIDTGACHGKSLTALILPAFELVSVPARADYWRATRRRWEVPRLRSQGWAAMTFDQLARRAGERADGTDADGRAFLDGVRAWSADVRGAIPRLSAAADAAIAELVGVHGDAFPKAVASHPAGKLLIRRHAGRLSADSLGCAGPADVFRLADQLGIELGLGREP